MVQETDRTATEAGSRSADGRRFEVFVRIDEPEPLRHVGTVKAPTPDAAHERASELFGRDVRDVWLCPAERTHRYSSETLADGRAPERDTSDGRTARSRTAEIDR